MHPSGDIYLACGIINGCNVAAKLESISSKGQTLEHDFHVLKILSGGMGLPNVQWFGSEGGYNAIVFDCLGPSLEDLFIGSNYKICRRTVSNLAKQLVSQTNYFMSVVNIFHRSVIFSIFTLGRLCIMISNPVIFS